MSRTVLALLALGATPALAGPADAWMPAVADCSRDAESLEVDAREDLAACRSCGPRRALTACMEEAGWRPAEDDERGRYDRFCALTAQLELRTTDDLEVVAALPGMPPADAVTLSTPHTP